MGRAQQDEALHDTDKEGKVTLRRSLACALLPGHPSYIGIENGLGGEKKMQWGQCSEPRRDGRLTKRGKARCVDPLHALSYQATLVTKA